MNNLCVFSLCEKLNLSKNLMYQRMSYTIIKAVFNTPRTAEKL